MFLLVIPSQFPTGIGFSDGATPYFVEVDGGAARFAEILPRIIPPIAESPAWDNGPVDSYARFKKSCLVARSLHRGMTSDEWFPMVQKLSWHPSNAVFRDWNPFRDCNPRRSEFNCDYLRVDEDIEQRRLAQITLSWR
jgi:hypothetical protein